MKPVENETLVRQLNWRYATKKFDPAKKISAADWQTLEQSLVLSPSSYGLQPWKFFVVDDPAIRAKLHPHAWNQPQIIEASHLVVFAIKSNLNATDVERYIARMADVRGVSAASLDGLKQMIVGSVEKPGAVEWATRQVYIALGMFLSAAALVGIDACPMEGFVPEKFDETLGLTKLGYSSVVLATAGYRSADDKYGSLPKVRFKHEEVVTHIG